MYACQVFYYYNILISVISHCLSGPNLIKVMYICVILLVSRLVSSPRLMNSVRVSVSQFGRGRRNIWTCGNTHSL